MPLRIEFALLFGLLLAAPLAGCPSTDDDDATGDDDDATGDDDDATGDDDDATGDDDDDSTGDDDDSTGDDDDSVGDDDDSVGDDDDSVGDDDDSAGDDDDSTPDPTDGDGDGFGAADDCDDGDPTIYPGAPELCDGIDSDCGSDLEPSGLARWVGASGSVDLAATFALGTPNAPVAWTPPESGTLHLCPGTWSVAITGAPGEVLAVLGYGLSYDVTLDTREGGVPITVPSGATVNVENITISGGRTTAWEPASAVQVESGGTAALTYVFVRDCVAQTPSPYEGAVNVEPGGTLTLDVCSFNQVPAFVSAEDATVTIGGTSFVYGSTAGSLSGVISMVNTNYEYTPEGPIFGDNTQASLQSCVFTGVGSPAGGPALSAWGDYDLTIQGTIFVASPGLPLSFSGSGNVTIVSSNVSGGTGGCLSFSSTGDLVVSYGAFSNCTSSSGGGGVNLAGSGTATFSDTDIVNNTATAGPGGGLLAGVQITSLTYTGGSISNNQAQGDGGGFYVEAPIAMDGTALLSNSAAGAGGGGAAMPGGAGYSFTGVEFTANSSGTHGGGLHLPAPATLSTCIFAANTAQGDGGGLWSVDSTLVETSMTNNVAAGVGGGWYAGYGGTGASATGGSVYGNSAASGGGIGLDTQLSLSGVDFSGTPANIPSDVGNGGLAVTFGPGPITASCSPAGCL